jgi:hypothetical protein
MERRSKKRSSSARSEKMERVDDRQEKNGGILFDRPKPTADCSEEEEEEEMVLLFCDLREPNFSCTECSPHMTALTYTICKQIHNFSPHKIPLV